MTLLFYGQVKFQIHGTILENCTSIQEKGLFELRTETTSHTTSIDTPCW